jgi:hypothetical protein
MTYYRRQYQLRSSEESVMLDRRRLFEAALGGMTLVSHGLRASPDQL